VTSVRDAVSSVLPLMLPVTASTQLSLPSGSELRRFKFRPFAKKARRAVYRLPREWAAYYADPRRNEEACAALVDDALCRFPRRRSTACYDLRYRYARLQVLCRLNELCAADAIELLTMLL
jgi:hypothetical protein